MFVSRTILSRLLLCNPALLSHFFDSLVDVSLNLAGIEVPIASVQLINERPVPFVFEVNQLPVRFRGQDDCDRLSAFVDDCYIPNSSVSIEQSIDKLLNLTRLNY